MVVWQRRTLPPRIRTICGFAAARTRSSLFGATGGDVQPVEAACWPPTHVIHGLHDRVVPIDGSRRYAAHGATLFETDDDHGLRQSMDHMVKSVHSLMGNE